MEGRLAEHQPAGGGRLLLHHCFVLSFLLIKTSLSQLTCFLSFILLLLSPILLTGALAAYKG